MRLATDGFEPHPSWTSWAGENPVEARNQSPFGVSVCAFGPTEAPGSPYGDHLWGYLGTSSPLGQNCQAGFWPTASTDADGFTILPLRQEFYGYNGWSDCLVATCFVVLNRSVIDHTTDFNITGSHEGVAMALLPVDESTPRPPRPAISIASPEPFTLGSTITLEITHLFDGYTAPVALCHVDNPWGCGYQAFDSTNGPVNFTLFDDFAQCGDADCYFQIGSSSEGLPPFAVVPLS